MTTGTEQRHFSKGSRPGPNELDSTIGAGGMNAVFRARDKRLNRDGVVKELPGMKRACIIPSSGCYERA